MLIALTGFAHENEQLSTRLPLWTFESFSTIDKKSLFGRRATMNGRFTIRRKEACEAVSHRW
jgi:hypothetical protein